MTYTKIYIPSANKEENVSFQNHANSDVHCGRRIKVKENSPSEIHVEQIAKGEKNEFVHRPEIVITDTSGKEKVTTTKVSHFRFPSASSLLSVVALCLASFIIGTSVTDNALSAAVVRITTATLGQIPDTPEYTDKTLLDNEDTDDKTLYQKYMVQDDFSDSGVPLSYLTVNPIISSLQTQDKNADITQTKEVSVESMSSGPIGADGEILYPVVLRDLSCDDVHSLNNQTRYNPDTNYLLSKTPSALQSLSTTSGEPLVLVVHTHGTESYNMCSAEGFYSTSLPVRSENISENVVGIGQKIVSVLNDFGIPAIHSEKLCDKESFVHAYSTSADEVKKYLEKYPSIRFVIDLHRDSIESADKVKTNPCVYIAGKEASQLMFVVGTDAAGASHPDWKENLSLALRLQSDISEYYPGLFRRINLRTASFNQQLSGGYLLLECGSCASSLRQAENAAEMFATGLARVIKNYSL